MRNNGYAYAGWAQGVADGDTIAGLAALDYLNDSAKMMGAVGPEATELLPETIQNIKAGMAQAYLDTLIVIANASPTKTISRDITAQEVWGFHERVFVDNGLTIQNWTLNIPFTVVEAFEGSDGLERFWGQLRDTEGEGTYAIWNNTLVFTKMALYAGDAFDGPYESMAEEWIDLVGIRDTFVAGFLGTVSAVKELFGEVSEDVLLSRAMMEIFLHNLAVPTDEQQEQITSIVKLVNDPETARLYIDSIRALFLGGRLAKRNRTI